MRLVYMGSPDFAVLPLRHLVRNGYEVAGVYTKPDKPSGRGQMLSASPVKTEALALGLPVVQPRNLRSSEAQAELESFKPEAIVVCAYGQILPQAVLALPRWGCLNIHPSLLPRHRGAVPVVSTILAGDEFCGVSIMLMDEGLDTGPVLTRAQVLVREEDTTGSLSNRLSLISAHLIQDVLSGWVRGELAPQPQDSSQATYFKSITKEAGEINWRLPALNIWRRVRAYQPWPGAYTRYQGRVLKIIEARAQVCQPPGVAGKVVAMDSGFSVATTDGVLEVLRVQLEGKQAMTAQEFLRGQRQFVGTVLPS